MSIECLDCNYNCGNPHVLLFHYKMERKDKVGKCACGNESKSGNCVSAMLSKIRGINPK